MTIKKIRLIVLTSLAGLFVTACFMVAPFKTADSALTSGAPPHSHTGVTTGGSTLTSPIINTASIISPTITGASYTGTQNFSAVDVVGHLTAATANIGGGRLSATANGALVYGDFDVSNDSSDGSDNGYISLASSATLDQTRGAYIQLNGNEASSNPGLAELASGASGSVILRSGTGSGPTPTYTLTLNSSGVLSSSRACDTGYTRVTPNYCRKTSYDLSATTINGVCSTVDGPTSATALQLRVYTLAKTASLVSTARNTAVHAYNTSSCSDPQLQAFLSYAQGYEFVSAANVTAGADTNDVKVKTDSNGDVFVKFVSDSGGNGTASYFLMGYYD